MTYALIPLLFLLVGLAYWHFQLRPSRAAQSGSGERLDTIIGWQPRVTRVMTAAEQQAYDTLRAALPEYMVLSQVPLSRFMKVNTRNSYSEWLRRVGYQCADLVICDRNSKVFAVVEVQSGKNDANARAAKRNSRKARSLKAAGIALHIWPEHALPSEKQVRTLLWSSSDRTTDLAGLAPTMETAPAPAPAAVAQRSPAAGRFAATAPASAAQNDAVVTDDGAEFNDAPPSTWFDDLDSSPMPLAPAAQEARQSSGLR